MTVLRSMPALLALLCGAAAGADVLAAVRVAHLAGPIHSVSSDFVARVLDAADEAGDDLVVLELDTPGGLGTSMKDIIQDIIQSPVPVCVYVHPGGGRAASAGFLILISADVAAMSPGTNTGSAHPIFSGEEVVEEGKRHILLEKVANDAAAFARTLAENRGRNVDLAERAVRDSLNFTEGEALEQGLIDLTASNLDQLLERLDGMEIRRFDGAQAVLEVSGLARIDEEMTSRERVLAGLANPSLAFILFAVGAVGLYVEFTHPGLIFPGVIGAVALLLFGFSAQILPINWVGLLFLACGLGLFVLELKVTSYGALTAGGILCLFLGGFMLYETPDIPEMRIPTGLLLAVSGATGILTASLLALVVRAHRAKIETGEEGLVGEIGTVILGSDGAARVFVHGEYWNVEPSAGLSAGERVRIVGVDGLVLRVERAP